MNYNKYYILLVTFIFLYNSLITKAVIYTEPKKCCI